MSGVRSTEGIFDVFCALYYVKRCNYACRGSARRKFGSSNKYLSADNDKGGAASYAL